MKSGWYLSILIVVLTLFGFSQQDNHAPNQEIRVQFSAEQVSDDTTENTIAAVKSQLKDIGVRNIKVQRSADGTFKLTYHSDVDVTVVKEVLSHDNSLEFAAVGDLENQDIPWESSEDGQIKNYKLDISEIRSALDHSSDINGVSLQVLTEHERLYVPFVYYSAEKIDIKEQCCIDKIAYSLHGKNAIALDNSLYKIPEVRAGPLT